MSLFPAYIAPGEEQKKDRGHEVVQVAGEGLDCPGNLSIETFLQIFAQEGDVVKQTPTWLTNTSFKDFQETVNKTQPIEVLSSSSDEQGRESKIWSLLFDCFG